MKLVRFTDTPGAADSTARLGLIKGDGVVDITSAVAGLPSSTPQMLMEAIIDKGCDLSWKNYWHQARLSPSPA